MRDSPALVAYEQSNGTYDVHRSDRLGRALHHAWRITEVTPLGYSTCDEESVVIEPAVLERRLSIQELVDELDYATFGAVVVVSETYTVTPYRALWFGFEDACRRVHVSERIGNGALVNLPDLHGAPLTDATFCARYTAVKRTLGGLIDDGRLSRREADRHLRTHVALLEDDGHDVRFASGTQPSDADPIPESPAAAIVDRLLGRD